MKQSWKIGICVLLVFCTCMSAWAESESWRDREISVPSFKRTLVNMTKEQVKAKLGPPDDSSQISWEYGGTHLRDMDSGKVYKSVTIWFQNANNTRASSFSFSNAQKNVDQAKGPNRSKRLTVSQFKRNFKGKTKAEVKGVYGPPDDSSQISWEYSGMNVYDPDSEKTYQNVTFWFQAGNNTRASNFSFSGAE